MNTFAKLLKAQQKKMGLSTAKLAETLGVGYNSLCIMLKGKSVPNATTIQKYATFMAVTPDRILELAGKKKKGAAVPAVAQPAPTAKPAKVKAKTKVAKRTAPAAPATIARAPLAAVNPATITVAQMTAVMNDALAMAVHDASETKRAFVAALLKA